MTNVLPVCNPQCPYKIPLSSYVYVAARGFESILRRWIQPHLIPLPAYALQLYRATWSELHQIRTAVSIPCDLYLSEKPIDAKTVQQQPRNLQLWETPAVETNGQLLDAQMLTWLCKMSANPTVGNVVAAPHAELLSMSNHVPHPRLPGKRSTRGTPPLAICCEAAHGPTIV